MTLTQWNYVLGGWCLGFIISLCVFAVKSRPRDWPEGMMECIFPALIWPLAMAGLFAVRLPEAFDAIRQSVCRHEWVGPGILSRQILGDKKSTCVKCGKREEIQDYLPPTPKKPQPGPLDFPHLKDWGKR